MPTRGNPQPATTSNTTTSRGRGQKRKAPSATSAATNPGKKHHGTDSLTRNDLPDIIAAVLDILPNVTGASSVRSNLSVTPALVDPLSEPPTPNKEEQHQELGESYRA